MFCLTFSLAGDGGAEKNKMKVEEREHDFTDALNELRDSPNIKVYSQAPDRHNEKQLTQNKKVKVSRTTASTFTLPEKHNYIPQRKGGVVKAQWGFFKKIGRAFKRVGRKIWRGIKRVGKKIWRSAKRVGRKVWRGLKRFGRKVWRGVKKVGKKVWRGVKRVAKKAWKGIKKAGKWAWKGIKKVGKVALKFAKSPIGQTLIKGGLTALGVPPMVSGPLLGTVTGLADNLLGGSLGQPPNYSQQSNNYGPPSGYYQQPSGYGQQLSGYGQSPLYY